MNCCKLSCLKFKSLTYSSKPLNLSPNSCISYFPAFLALSDSNLDNLFLISSPFNLSKLVEVNLSNSPILFLNSFINAKISFLAALSFSLLSLSLFGLEFKYKSNLEFNFSCKSFNFFSKSFLRLEKSGFEFNLLFIISILFSSSFILLSISETLFSYF